MSYRDELAAAHARIAQLEARAKEPGAVSEWIDALEEEKRGLDVRIARTGRIELWILGGAFVLPWLAAALYAFAAAMAGRDWIPYFLWIGGIVWALAFVPLAIARTRGYSFTPDVRALREAARSIALRLTEARAAAELQRARVRVDVKLAASEATVQPDERATAQRRI